jgi:IclR family pca regulon transcriptional regulator
MLLASLPEAEARASIEACDLAPRTPYSLTDTDRILEAVRQAREKGYALIDQEVELGLRSIAVALVGHNGQIRAALNVAVAAVQPDAQDLVTLYLPELRGVQSGLSRLLP